MEGNTFKTFVPGRPKGKERPRAAVGSKSGKPFMYSPSTTVKIEAEIRDKALAWMEAQGMVLPHEGPVKIKVLNLYARPKNYFPGKEPMGGHSDIDNLMKVAMDALNRTLFRDDAQIVQGVSAKMYHDKPGMFIQVELLPVVEKPKGRKR